MFKNVASQKIAIYAYDAVNETAKTGDAAQITAQISLDGEATAATNDASPTELDSTDAPGIYLFDMTQAETNADLVVLSSVSSTDDIVIEPIIIYPVITAAIETKIDTIVVATITNATGADVATDIKAIKAETVLIVEDTGELQTNQSAWTTATTTTLAGLTVDVISVSGDTTSANNLELQYDGNGLAGDTFPATQAQMLNITNSGSAVSRPASSYTLTTGNQTANLYTDTAALNGTKHTHTDDGNEMVLDYEFNIGSGTPSSVTITGALTGNNDDLEVAAYDYIADEYVQIGILEGKVSTKNEVDEFAVYTSMVGTGANLGDFKVRFRDGDYTLSTATLYIDQIRVNFNMAMSGYELGAIWVDDSVSNEGVVVGTDGVATNPVSTWAAALSLSALTNLNKFEIANGSAIELTANSDSYCIRGTEYTLALAGQSIAGSCIHGATVSGTSAGINARFYECKMGTVSLTSCGMQTCALTAGITLTSSGGTYIFDNCFSAGAGTDKPSIDLENAAENKYLNMRHYSGGIEFKNFGHAVGTHVVSLEGDGQYILNSSCDAAIESDVLNVRGNFEDEDNVSGGWGGTINEEARFDATVITNAVPTVTQITADMDANSTQLAAIVLDTGTTIPGTITTLQTTADSIEGDTQDLQTQIGTDGAGLTNLPWNNSVWDAEVQSECLDAINSYDPSTRTEDISDRNDIIDQVNANETKIDIIDINVDQLETAIITNAAGTDIAADIIALKSVADLTLTDTGTTIPAQIAALDTVLDDYLDTGGTIELLVQAINTAVVTNAAGTDIAADVASLQVDTTAILTDTGTTIPDQITALDATLDSYLANGGTIDVLIDAIKAKTDSLTFTTASKVDSNVYLIEAVDATNQLDAHGGTGNTTSLAAITGLLEADKEIDLTTDSEQGTLLHKTKGTDTVILKKNLLKPDGDPVTAASDRIAAEENVSL